MKLPSIQLLTQSLLRVIQRFPFVLAAAVICTGIGITLIEFDFANRHVTEQLIKAGLVSSLGLPLFFAVHIFCEKWHAKPIFTFAALLTALFLLVQYYFSIPLYAMANGNFVFRFVFWSAGMHLLASFSAFFVAEELNGFWQFNKQLFLRFLTAALYAGVLFLGLAGAILAVDQLFNLHLDGDLYADLWVVIAGLFNTVFFLGGVEEPVEHLQNETGYPKGLKIFTQYVLLPLVTVYLVILYAYLGKIIMQHSLPKGWVSNLILGFSVTGILSLLLVWPLREQEENKWIKTFTRFFYFSLLPLIALLFIAIGTRINAYGVTIERYIVAMLGVWLALITLYFIFSSRKNIILIPLTLALFLFGSCFGPWGMFAVAERSQVKRLKVLMEKNGMLVNGKLVKISDSEKRKIKANDLLQINSALDYLATNRGLYAISNWMDEDCRKEVFKDSLLNSTYTQLAPFQKCVGIDGYANYPDLEQMEADQVLEFHCNLFQDNKGVDVSGFSHLYTLSADEEDAKEQNLNYATLKDNALSIYIENSKVGEFKLDTVVARLKNTIPENSKGNFYSPAQTTFTLTLYQGKPAKLIFASVRYIENDTTVKVTAASAYLLVNYK